MREARINNLNKRAEALNRAFKDHPGLVSEIHALYVTGVHMNRSLQTGKYFYHDVITEGIRLYDSGDIELAPYRELPMTELQGETRAAFESTFERALGFQKGFEFYLLEGNDTLAVFNLHQMTEHLFHTLITVFTNYRNRSHNLEFLEKQAGSQYQPILGIFPRETEEQRQQFEQLQVAYVDARYRSDFVVHRQHLIEVAGNVARLQQMVFDACVERIRSYVPERKVKPYIPTQSFLDMDTLLNTPPPKEVIAQQRAELERSNAEFEAARKREEQALQRAVIAEQEKEQALRTAEEERKAREQAEKEKDQERAEKERLKKLLEQSGIDPTHNDGQA